MTFYPFFNPKYVSAYRISLESAKAPKNRRKSVLKSPEYPKQVNEKGVGTRLKHCKFTFDDVV